MITPSQLPAPEYEPRDAHPGFVLLIAVLLGGLVAGTLAASACIYHARYARAPTAPYYAGEKSFRQGAEWQSGIARDWAEENRRTHETLTTYGWVDRKTGVVRVPIEQAMSLVAQEAKP